MLGSSGGGMARQETAEVAAQVIIGSNSGEDGGDRSFSGGGIRWPRQETLALLKIRSDMDAAFRDSSLKGSLWEEISRKMGELGYKRSGKKCKEKFENVYKYHRRTKDGRSGKSEGKTYRFFEELEAFENVHNNAASPPKPQTPPAWNNSHPTPVFLNPIQNCPTNQTAPFSHPPMNPRPITASYPLSDRTAFNNLQHCTSNPHRLSTNSTSSSTASDEEEGSEIMGSRKRKWKVFFRRLTKEVIEKQEKLQEQFLETIERREKERMNREEAWRDKEMEKMNREYEILIQRRSSAAAKDAALVAFLHSASSGGQIMTAPPPPPPPQLQPNETAARLGMPPVRNEDEKYANGLGPSPSRWPKAEIEALIHLRTNMENNYQENGPKATLWEDISAAMRRLGYNRNAKRCKEKWENINKYFKKVRESNKKRPEDSKTCPYFEQLDAIYREKSRTMMAEPPLMVHPEQQWPPQNVVHPDDDDNDDGDSDEDEDGFEVVASKAAAGVGDAN